MKLILLILIFAWAFTQLDGRGLKGMDSGDLVFLLFLSAAAAGSFLL